MTDSEKISILTSIIRDITTAFYPKLPSSILRTPEFKRVMDNLERLKNDS